jgi:3D (Asp-Asp-Asp) domain-containing protein
VRKVSTIAAALALASVTAASAAGPTLNSLESQRRSAVLDLYALDSRVAAAQERLSALQQQAANLRAQQLLLRQQWSAAHLTLVTSRSELAVNLRNLYKRGSVSTLAVVLGATSLDDAMTQLDTLDAVASQNKQMASLTKHAEARIGALREALAARRAALASALAAAHATLTSLTDAQATRIAFIARLRSQERVKRAQIAAWETRVRVAQQKSAKLTAAVPAVAQTPVSASPPAGARSIVVASTGYSLPGHTATGLPVGWGVVAVDPSVIPLGSKLSIPGYGDGVAADVGSGVRGNDIDLWFPTLGQARAWGRRTVTITLH